MLQNIDFNRNNTYAIVHFCFCLVRPHYYFFFDERNPLTTNKTRYFSTVHPQTWCIFFLFLYACFFKKFNPLSFSGSLLYIFGNFIDNLQSILNKNKVFQKKYRLFRFTAVFFLFQTRIICLLHLETSNGLRFNKTFTITCKFKSFSQKKRNKHGHKAPFKQRKVTFKQKFVVLIPFSFYF